MSDAETNPPMSEPIVYVVDDERDLCESLAMMLEAEGFRCRTFTSAEAFLEQFTDGDRGVLLLDMKLDPKGRRMNGAELQQKLNRRGVLLPIVFMTGHGDVPMAVRTLKAGAHDFLEKPVDTNALFTAVRRALDHDAETCTLLDEYQALAARLGRLTPREREVLEAIATGESSKSIGQRMNISERTVEAHRRHLMQKMLAHNAPELVHIHMRFTELSARLKRGTGN